MTELLKTAREIAKSMTNVKFIVNNNFDKVFVNFFISDGENTIAADSIDGYFTVNGKKINFPYYAQERKRLISFVESFAKNHKYEYGLNPM